MVLSCGGHRFRCPSSQGTGWRAPRLTGSAEHDDEGVRRVPERPGGRVVDAGPAHRVALRVPREVDGAHGEVFLRRTAELVRGAGYRVVNVAVQVMAVRPKLSPRRAEAERILSAAVGAPVSLAGTTTDGLGFTGRGDGVAAVATALVERV